jgi:hypothetical protein
VGFPLSSSGCILNSSKIAVTLTEWERVTDRFVGSTNYQEKALLKLLSSSIVPAVTEHLRVRREAEMRSRG